MFYYTAQRVQSNKTARELGGWNHVFCDIGETVYGYKIHGQTRKPGNNMRDGLSPKIFVRSPQRTDRHKRIKNRKPNEQVHADAGQSD